MVRCWYEGTLWYGTVWVGTDCSTNTERILEGNVSCLRQLLFLYSSCSMCVYCYLRVGGYLCLIVPFWWDEARRGGRGGVRRGGGRGRRGKNFFTPFLVLFIFILTPFSPRRRAAVSSSCCRVVVSSCRVVVSSCRRVVVSSCRRVVV